MKLFLLTLVSCLTLQLATAQDTTWVQTFTFDSITSRRAEFQFPASLDTKRFEKVLMYYKLKCSPLTTWDQYNCGEWDYLTYTRIFDHTGVMDSVRADGMRYRINTLSPVTSSYNLTPTYDQVWKNVQRRTPGSTTSHLIAGTASTPMAIVNSGSNGHTMQWIVSAADLLASGATTGDLQAMEFAFQNAVSNLQNVSIRLKATNNASLTSWETTGFTSVFNDHLSGITAGNHQVNFGTPFTWNGTSNIVIELSYTDANTASSMIQLGAQNSGVATSTLDYDGRNGVFRTTTSNHAEVNLSNVDLGGDVTIAFWAKGNASFGTNTSVLEAVDSLNNRILNIHFPWSDNSVYFDAGSGNGYDRINKVATAADIDNIWHHWAFVKKTSTGQMFIYKDGVLWHSGTGLTRPIGKIARFVLGSNWNQEYQYSGDLDEFTVWTTALDVATIAAWKDKKIDASHPDYSALEVYYDFDNTLAMVDKSGNNRLGMPSQTNMVQWDAYPVAGKVSGGDRPAVSFVQGTYGAATADSVLETQFPQPKTLYEYTPLDNSFYIVNNSLIYDKTTTDTTATNGSVSSSANTLATTITNDTIYYYNAPFEIVHDVEIGRYITPYGIGFDLGPQGFTWIYDVTDYQKYLNGLVDLAAHNTQELIDLRFAFIEGTPPRDVDNVEPIWSNFRSYQYSDLDNDNVLSSCAESTLSLSKSLYW